MIIFFNSPSLLHGLFCVENLSYPFFTWPILLGNNLTHLLAFYWLLWLLWNYYIRWIVKRAIPSTRQRSASVVIRFELSHAYGLSSVSKLFEHIVINVETFCTHCDWCNQGIVNTGTTKTNLVTCQVSCLEFDELWEVLTLNIQI